MRILSLGAGVQSSTLAIMAERGDIEKIDCAIFADTGSEPRCGKNSVYSYLDYLKTKVSYPIYVVSAGNLKEKSLILRTSKRSGKRYVKGYIPAFVLKPDGKVGLLGRICTAEFKILPVARKVKELLGIKRASKNSPVANLLIGISKDEAHRMKPSRIPYVKHSWPLIDEVSMSREDCKKYMLKNGYKEPPRSSCTFCPFHGDDEWRRIYGTPDFEEAVQYEKDIQEVHKKQNALEGIPFLHQSCKPLDTINFKDKKAYKQLDIFGNECEGLCGV